MPLQGRSRLGPYRLLARVGEGGFGVVYLGLDDWGRAVAVRALRPLVGLNYDFEVLRRVSGPHVAELYAANADAGTSYVATRYVPGRSLEAVLAEDGPLGGRALIRLALGLADGLCSLHEVRVVHGQLEPGAVLVDDDHPVIIDIGVVQTGEGFLSTFGRGTAGFTAPEVDREAPSAAADVYAWAALVTYAATSRPPYSGRADAVGLPEPLASLVAAALAPDPAQRPTARELRDRLGETLGETFGAPREQQPEPDVPVVPEQRRGETTTAVVERPRGWRRGHRLIGVELVVLAGIVAAIAPTVSAIGIVSLILILRFADHIARSAARRREARGRSAWNAVRAVLALPWHATRTVAETLLCIPVAALVAASGTVPVVLVTDELRPTAAMTAGTAAAASWLGLGGRPLRRVTGKILNAVVPSRVSAILASVALAGGVAGLCTVLLSEPPDWWPLDSTPSLDALDRWWRR
jgi:hypothetical protein